MSDLVLKETELNHAGMFLTLGIDAATKQLKGYLTREDAPNRTNTQR